MSNKNINITINNNTYEVAEGITILDACRAAGIKVPTLCYMEDVSHNASCGICSVEVQGARTLVRSCIHKVYDGIEILTNSKRVQRARKTNLELLLANHPDDCLNCDRNNNCELQTLAFDLGVRENRYARTRKKEIPIDV